MDAYTALAEPTRRTILLLLAKKGKLPATQIYKEFSMSAPAVSQHLQVLKEANLVEVEKQAQVRLYKLNPEPLLAMDDWIKDLTRMWNQRFDALEKVIEEEKQNRKKGDE